MESARVLLWSSHLRQLAGRPWTPSHMNLLFCEGCCSQPEGWVKRELRCCGAWYMEWICGSNSSKKILPSTKPGPRTFEELMPLHILPISRYIQPDVSSLIPVVIKCPNIMLNLIILLLEDIRWQCSHYLLVVDARSRDDETHIVDTKHHSPWKPYFS